MTVFSAVIGSKLGVDLLNSLRAKETKAIQDNSGCETEVKAYLKKLNDALVQYCTNSNGFSVPGVNWNSFIATMFSSITALSSRGIGSQSTINQYDYHNVFNTNLVRSKVLTADSNYFSTFKSAPAAPSPDGPAADPCDFESNPNVDALIEMVNSLNNNGIQTMIDASMNLTGPLIQAGVQNLFHPEPPFPGAVRLSTQEVWDKIFVDLNWGKIVDFANLPYPLPARPK